MPTVNDANGRSSNDEKISERLLSQIAEIKCTNG